MTTERKVFLATVVVVLHLAILGLHTAAHLQLNIIPPLPQLSFVFVVLTLAPIIAIVLLVRGRRVVGAVVLLGSMAASLVFGIVSHLVLPGSDNFAEVAPGTWGSLFKVTSVLLAILEAVGVVLGAWALSGRPSAVKPLRAEPRDTTR